MEPVLYIGLAFAGLLIFNKLQTAGTAERLNYLITSADWDFEILQITVRINVGIQNPTSSSLDFNSLVGSVYLNGEYLANVNSFQPVTILPNAQTNIQIIAYVSTLSMAGELIDWLKTPSGVITSLKGTVNVGNMAVPIDLSYKLI